MFAYILSSSQRKLLDRDPRCSDARSKTEAFVASEGKEQQAGVDAMSALEKCAVLSRVGDWSDFRNYVITAAAAVAYKVGADAGDDRLLHRATDDAAHVDGFQAANASVTLVLPDQQDNPESNSTTGHGLTEGPAESSARNVHELKHVAAYSGTYGKIATDIARAANDRLLQLATPAPAKH